MFDTYGPENDVFFEMYRGIADEVGLEKVHNATRYSGTTWSGCTTTTAKKREAGEARICRRLNRGRIACSRPLWPW
jgi:hypothetical protein